MNILKKKKNNQLKYIKIIYQDNNIVVINKLANTIVYGKSLGNFLLSNILYSNKNIPRSGIIHRLDKETSGVMILAKTIVAYIKLLSHQQAGLITKIYFALVTGTMDDSGTINMPIGKKKGNNFKMIIDKDGKTSTTHYKIIKQYYDYNYIKILLDTGRTHQIRVHMEHIHNPVFQDKVYNIYSKKINHKTQLQRHALHASQISFYHPVYKIPMHFISMLPGDLKNLLFISK